MTEHAVQSEYHGHSDHGVQDPVRLLRETQLVRIHQSNLTLPLIAVAGATLILTLWDDAPHDRLIAWIGLIFFATVVRTVVCLRIKPRLASASLEEMRGFEFHLLWSALLNSGVMGAGFWLVCLDGTERAVFAVTLVCSIYAIGAMINASVQFASFVPSVVINIGQGILFFSGVGGTWEPALAIPLTAMLLLLIGFGRENARQFAESIRMREENLALLAQLNIEKQSVEQALTEARDANNAKSRFLAAASHDLRQPLHALNLFIGSLSLLVEGGQAERLIKRIGDTTTVLGEQFNGLLDLSRFDAGGIVVETSDFSLQTLLEDVVEEMRGDAERKGLALSADAPPLRVHSDKMLITRLIRNLLSNAVRYTQTGEIRVAAEKSQGRVRVVIKDTGPGIADDDRERVFEDFVQLHNPARSRDRGVGLGLAIVRRIDHLLGLDLELTTAPGQGSSFALFLPMAEAGDEAVTEDGATAVDDAGSIRGFHVWAIEDDPDVGEALAIQLRAWGCPVRVMTSPEEIDVAYAQAGAWPDVLLIDDMLGATDTGLDIACRLSGSMDRERLIIVTGNSEPARLNELRDSGFRILLKPTSPEQLRQVLQSVTGPAPVTQPALA